MKWIPFFWVIAVVVLGAGRVFAHPQPQNQKGIDDSKSAAQRCDGPQIALEVCESNIYHSLDTRMNDLYKKQMARLGPESKAALRDAQRAWLVFRDKSCDYEAGKDPYGYMETIQYSCLQDITRRRIEDLTSYLECAQNGCPSD